MVIHEFSEYCCTSSSGGMMLVHKRNKRLLATYMERRSGGCGGHGVTHVMKMPSHFSISLKVPMYTIIQNSLSFYASSF